MNYEEIIAIIAAVVTGAGTVIAAIIKLINNFKQKKTLDPRDIKVIMKETGKIYNKIEKIKNDNRGSIPKNSGQKGSWNKKWGKKG